MSLKPGFHMVIAVNVSICRRLIGDMSPMRRSRSPTVTIISKPGLRNNNDRSIVPKTIVLMYGRREQENDYHLL